MDKYCKVEASPDQLDKIVRSILLILDIARKHVKGLTRGVPFSIIKLVGYAKLQYWIAKVKWYKDCNVNFYNTSSSNRNENNYHRRIERDY